MKRMKSLLALGLALAMAAFCLTGCSGSSEEEAESEAVEETYIASQAGGSITWPEGLDTSATFASQLDEASGTLYVVFNSVQNRFTNYFTPAGDSITVTSYATSEKDTATTQYLVTLWEEAEGGRAYVNGHTIEFATGGDCATGPATVIKAIAAAKVVAANIDEYLGYNHKITCDVEIPEPDLADKSPCGRVELTERQACERIRDFEGVENCMTDKEACQEAGRCLRCDHFGFGLFKGGREKVW